MVTQTVEINIERGKVYAIAEGISVTISQHNAGTPTYEQLWASEDEAKKLDIWYREAISDLERNLMKWVATSSGQFDLSEDGTDYKLTLKLSQYWPARLEGLLNNKIQDYLVHSVTAGWLNDFSGLEVKQDYQAMAAQDVKDVIDIICMQSFGFSEAERQDDGSDKNPSSIDATARQDDGSNKNPSSIDATARQDDGKKNAPSMVVEAGYRRKDEVKKTGMDDKPPLARDRTNRHKDNAIVDTRQDYTDMSGTDIAHRMADPCGQIYRHDACRPITRPMMGMGYTPHPTHPPVPEPPAPKPPMEPEVYEQPPVHAVPPKFAPLPPIHANGKGWSDEADYDMEAEEKFVNSHVCGQHTLEDDGDLFQPIDSSEEFQ